MNHQCKEIGKQLSTNPVESTTFHPTQLKALWARGQKEKCDCWVLPVKWLICATVLDWITHSPLSKIWPKSYSMPRDTESFPAPTEESCQPIRLATSEEFSSLSQGGSPVSALFFSLLVLHVLSHFLHFTSTEFLFVLYKTIWICHEEFRFFWLYIFCG